MDKYLIEENSNKYVQLKKAINECYEQRNVSKLNKLINSMKTTSQVHYKAYMGMAFYQNLTLLNKDLNSEAIQNLAHIFQHDSIQQLYSSESLFKNNYAHKLKVSKENWPHINLSCLLIQIKYSLFYSTAELIQPLKKLMDEPDSPLNKYFPTMSTDEFYDIFHSLVHSNVSDIHGLYACPNDHPYYIGNVFYFIFSTNN